MGTRDDATAGDGRVGPTLYLESGALDRSELFCTEVFDGADEGEYRVVQLTATQSFESLRDALDVQLERIHDPSEAAVIITTPQADDGAEVGRVGEETPLYGFRVNPQDLTGISVAFSRLIERWDETAGSVKICLRDFESLLPYHDTDLLYRFLNTVLATLQGAGADVHVHFRPSATDDQSLQMFRSLFARVVDQTDATGGPEAESPPQSESGVTAEDAGATAATPPDSPADSDPGSDAASDDVANVAMSDEEVDEFLESQGHGVLAFGGDPPYAIPMSYGYDADERVLYTHMSAFDGSEKLDRLADSDAVSFVVSRYVRPDRWRSVVVDGTLTRLSAASVDTRDVLDAFANSELATVDVFDRDIGDISFDWYVLDPASLSGRRSVGSL